MHIWIKENGKSPCTCMHLGMVCMTVLCDTLWLQAEFFITYVLTSWTGFPLEILQTGSLIFNFLKRHTVERKQQPLLDTVQSLPYYRTIPSILFFILLGLVYSIVNPLLLPFLLVYFILGYIVFRNQVFDKRMLSFHSFVSGINQQLSWFFIAFNLWLIFHCAFPNSYLFRCYLFMNQRMKREGSSGQKFTPALSLA